jgi:hypothetical protein
MDVNAAPAAILAVASLADAVATSREGHRKPGELANWPYHTDEWSQWLSDTRAGKNPPLPAAE